MDRRRNSAELSLERVDREIEASKRGEEEPLWYAVIWEADWQSERAMILSEIVEEWTSDYLW